VIVGGATGAGVARRFASTCSVMVAAGAAVVVVVFFDIVLPFVCLTEVRPARVVRILSLTCARYQKLGASQVIVANVRESYTESLGVRKCISLAIVR